MKDLGLVRRVLTMGVFDLFHLGHLRLFQQAKLYGQHLIVGVKKNVENHKNVEVFYSAEERLEMVRAIGIVDEVVFYEGINEVIEQIDFDVFVYGEDQFKPSFDKAIRYCQERGKEVVCARRTQGISSSQLRCYLQEDLLQVVE